MPDQVTIRMAGPADAGALRDLEALDSRELAHGEVLLAEVDGEVRAALAVDGGPAAADPFHPTAVLVELLEVHAAQLRRGEAHRAAPIGRALALGTR